MLKAAAGRLWSATAREGRRQVSARVAHRRARPGAGYVSVDVRRVPVVARLDASLLLGRQRAAFEAEVVDALTRDGIFFWRLPSPSAATAAVCVRVEDRPAVTAALARRAAPSWYVDPLEASGASRERWTGASTAHDLAAPGLRVWEFVAPGPGSTFVADQRQGLDILFWSTEDDVLTCLVRNGVATARPLADLTDPGELEGHGLRRSSTIGFPIDVVYTWVDGLDDAWLGEKARAAGVADPALFTERAHDESRYADHDELRHSLRALEQFAPWVHHVWVVTAGQHPSWLAQDDPWVTVVPHDEIWPDDRGLPTFNSHAIETCLHRIPGLAEHFLYLNDDMLLGRPVPPETFFHANGISKFFWSRALVDHGPVATGEIASTTAAKNARRLLEERYGVTFTRKFFHTGAALTVSGLAELEATFPEVVDATRRAPFRTVHDVAVAGSFYLNWAYATGRAVPGRLRYTYIDPAAPDAAKRLRALGRNRVFEAFCVNDGSSEETPEQRRATDRLIRDFFADYLPVPGSFEVASRDAGQRSKLLGSGK